MSALATLQNIPGYVTAVASVANKLTAEEERIIPLFIEGTKVFLKALAERLNSTTRASLLQYSSDCTPQRVRAQHFQKAGSLVWRGSSASSFELYVQQLFGTTFAADGSLVHFLLFKEPQVLSHGKIMAALLTCTMAFPGLATLARPREGISIIHVVQDRGMSPSYRHALSGWMCEQISQAQGRAGPTSRCPNLERSAHSHCLL